VVWQLVAAAARRRRRRRVLVARPVAAARLHLNNFKIFIFSTKEAFS